MSTADITAWGDHLTMRCRRFIAELIGWPCETNSLSGAAACCLCLTYLTCSLGGPLAAEDEPNDRDSFQGVIQQAALLSAELREDKASLQTVARQRELAAALRSKLQLKLSGRANSPFPATVPGGEQTASERAGVANSATPGNELRSRAIGTAEATANNPGSGPGPSSGQRIAEVGEDVMLPLGSHHQWLPARGIWGHFPPQERAELFRSFNSQFLPKYEAALQEYFRALAEQPGTATTP